MATSMKMLWIPHMPWPMLDGQRERRILESWPDSGDELHVLTWQPARNPFASLRWSTFREGRATVHSVPRIPNVLGRVAGSYARGLWANERLFRYHTRRLARRLGIDVLVYGIGHTVVGLPPFDLPVAHVFDYLDLITYPEVEAAYLAHSDLVLCTSGVLADRVRAFGRDAVYVPNGVSMARIAHGQRDLTRAALGLQGKRVVSFIGLTGSASLFFVDALALAARQIPDLVFLVVGGGELLQPIIDRCRRLEVPLVATGWVPSREVANYFAATDVGLYPGDSNPYFDAACPIKVLEYTAARRPVVATNLGELRRMAFPNVRLAAPNPSAFASAIITAFREPAIFADVASFEWTALARTMRQQLAGLLDDRRGAPQVVSSLVRGAAGL